MKSNDSGRRWGLPHIELLLVAVTLLATVVISALTLRQTTNHFRLERTTAFVARFNSAELVGIREDVDRWLESGESAVHLYDRSLAAAVDSSDSAVRDTSRNALMTIRQLRTLANFFQEIATAFKAGTLDNRYVHELIGARCIAYADTLKPFIEETRKRRDRKQAYAEVFVLRDKLLEMDQEIHGDRGQKTDSPDSQRVIQNK